MTSTTGVKSWSQTAATNASADSTINWSEGQAPSTVNDSARALMASVAKYRDDIAGAIATGGTSTAYTVTSYQVFQSLAEMHQQMVAFTPHTTCGATVTLNVDSLGAKPLRSSPSVELAAGTLIQGTPYLALYNNSDSAFYLHGFLGNSPYYIPIGSSVEYWGSSAPNSSFVFPFGQAISRTTYATLFALVGTAYGTGDGSTTFNIPDLRGRVAACLDNMGGSSANRLTGSYFGVSNVIGSAGGSESHTLTASEIPSITSSGSNSISVSFGSSFNAPVTQGSITPSSAVNQAGVVMPVESGGSWGSLGSMSGTNTINVTSNNTSGAGHNVVQPTILCNRILRVI